MQTDFVICKAPAKPPRLKKQLQIQAENEDRCHLSQLCQFSIQHKNIQNEEEYLGILSREELQVQEKNSPMTKQPRKRRVAPQPPPKPPPKPRKNRAENAPSDDHCAFIEQLFAETTEATRKTTVVAGKLSLGSKTHAIFALDVAALLISTYIFEILGMLSLSICLSKRVWIKKRLLLKIPLCIMVSKIKHDKDFLLETYI